MIQRWVCCAAATVGVLLMAGLAFASEFPSRPVHLIVPYAPGGAVDILARTLGEALAKTWGQQPVIDNRPGAGGIIASAAVVQASPDGYTLIIVASGHPVNQFLYANLPYDTFRDFTPIMELASSPNVILVNKNFPAKTLQELIDMARAKPGSLSYGMPGNGTSGHLAGELLKYMAKVDIVAIPYRGGAPELTALIASEIPMSINVVTESMAHIKNDSVRALAVTTAQRSTALPDIPTVSEAGVAGYDTGVWWGLLGPAGMAPDLVDKLHRDFTTALHDPTVQARLVNLGATMVANTPSEFAISLHAQAARWEPVIRAAHIAPQ